MNCPVRTDEDYLDHPEWNQNPPFLAPELTTRKDLNGTVNSRERDGGDTGEEFLLNSVNSLASGIVDGSAKSEKKLDVGIWSSKTNPHQITMELGGVDQVHLHTSHSRLPQGCTQSQTVLPWIVFAVVCSGVSFTAGSHWSTFSHDIDHLPERTQHDMRKFLYKRASTCPGDIDGASEIHYNTPLQIGAVFIILFVSGLACSFPTLAKHFPGLRLSPRFFFAVRHFGTGVLIATAFVHLLPTAFVSLGDPCLPSFWNEDYPAMPGAISLAGIFLVVIIEMVFHPGRCCVSVCDPECSAQIGPAGLVAEGKTCPNVAGEEAISLPMTRPIGGRQSSIGRTMSTSLAITPAGEGIHTEQATVPATAKAQSLSTLAEEQKLRKDRLQCVLLEVGILFHSVFIGMALSVSYGSDFVVLLVAISFHQTFEGLALGSRIASIAWPKKTVQPWLMCFAYGCTTPIGQAIGLGMRSLYSPDSRAGLLLVGIMNAISAGLLIFASLVELLSEDFLSDESWSHLRGTKRVVACFIVFLGAFLMSLIGAWA